MGYDPFGIKLIFHLDLTKGGALWGPIASDSTGRWNFPIPIPNAQNLVGLKFYTQAFWRWNKCNPSKIGFSSSNGLEIRLSR